MRCRLTVSYHQRLALALLRASGQLNAYNSEQTAHAASRVALRVACYTRAAAVVSPGDDMLAGALASQGIRPLTCSVRGGKAYFSAPWG